MISKWSSNDQGWLRSRILPISIQHADWFAQCSSDLELMLRAMNETWDAAHGIISDKYSYLDPLRGPRVSGIEGLRNRNPLHELIRSGDDKSISYHCVIWCCPWVGFATSFAMRSYYSLTVSQLFLHFLLLQWLLLVWKWERLCFSYKWGCYSVETLIFLVLNNRSLSLIFASAFPVLVG